ncbi:MAG: bifunctional hydroxymethylpyrimidine kinase/phosphomethylpyrimidine kinase [Chloroflexi bacterium]|nr:bifunctional hydroxymethylpyrimidine kinase/phosphomethylpyrimidine kinase [Chloroflexota bacterium]MBV9899401.1 bifunctional hydroxymethylpyrimidine kinase/phosphomethylpyrimidine kinase [Chloroflexota bacterium]
MTIAGSDSGGGAGIQADLKTFQALGVYGASTLTAVTAQNTVAVTAVHEIPTDLIAAQVDAVVSDIGVDAAKTGMLSSAAIISTVADRMRHWRIERLVVDPVMVAKSGDRLLRPDAVEALVRELLPLAMVLTPNVPEAEVLVGHTLETDEEFRQAAREIVAMGPRSVVMKGGHRAGDATDILFDGHEFVVFESERFDTKNTHGTGCTLSSAIAAGLARGLSVHESVGEAKRYVTEAIRRSQPLGQGHGPVAHDWLLARQPLHV